MSELEDALKDKEVIGLFSVLFDLLQEKTGKRYIAVLNKNKVVLSENKGKYYIYMASSKMYYTMSGTWSEDMTQVRLFTKKADATNVLTAYLYNTFGFDPKYEAGLWFHFSEWANIPLGDMHDTGHFYIRPPYSESTLRSEYKEEYGKFLAFLDNLNKIIIKDSTKEIKI